MNQTWKIFVSVVITAAVVGGGVYYWQQNKIQPVLVSEQAPKTESPVQTLPVTKSKSLDEYLSVYYKSSTKLSDDQIQKLVTVFSLGLEKCTSVEVSEFCSPAMVKSGMYISSTTLLSDAGWVDGKNHEFYFAEQADGPPAYYGPFHDNVLKLKQEASTEEGFGK